MAGREKMQHGQPKTGPTRADKFWSIFLFTKDGKVKSPLIIYSFSLSVVLLAVYGASYFFLVDAVHHALIGSAAWVSDLAESLIPGLIGAGLVSLLQSTSKGKGYIPAAYVWLLLYAVFILAAMMLTLQLYEDRMFFLSLFFRLVPVPLVVGGGISWKMYLKNSSRKSGGQASPPRGADSAGSF